MAAVAAIITHGDIPTTSFPLDEQVAATPTLLTQSLTISATREKKEYKNASGAVFGLQYRNPTISFAFDGYVSTISGIVDSEPGTAISSLSTPTLANFAGSIMGFSPADGTMVIEDPTRSGSIDDLMKSTFTVVQYPFVS